MEIKATGEEDKKMNALLLKIDPRDTVAIITEASRKGDVVDGITLLSDIPQGHKVALQDMQKGDEVNPLRSKCLAICLKECRRVLGLMKIP